MLTTRPPPSGSWAANGLRSMFPQSRKTTVRSRMSSGDVADEPVERQEPVLLGQRELVGVDVHDRVLARALEHLAHRDDRAQRVAVGVLVGDEQELVGRAELVEHRGRRPGRGRWRSRGRLPRLLDLVEQLGDPHAVVDRRRRRRSVSVGVCLRRSSEATRRWRNPWAELEPLEARLARVGSSPSTDTKTVAWRRSGEVSTEVTVTKPTRGSLRSVATASESTTRTASSTRRMRAEGILDHPPEVLIGDHETLERGAVGMAVEHEALDPVQPAIELAQRRAGQRGRRAWRAGGGPGGRPRRRRRRGARGAVPSARRSSCACPSGPRRPGRCRCTSSRAT